MLVKTLFKLVLVDISDIENPRMHTIEYFDFSFGYSDTLNFRMTSEKSLIITCGCKKDDKQMLLRREIPLKWVA